jgi:GT2 family glycosyltransferase
MITKPKVLISVLNYNNFECTKLCVQSILENIKGAHEILIVDNNSTDNSFNLIKKTFNQLTIVKSKINNGYAAGHQKAVNYAFEKKFQFIWILNNDLTVRKNSLEKLIDAYKKKGLGLYGSITLKSENPDVVNFGGSTRFNTDEPLSFNEFEGLTLDSYYKSVKLRKVQSIEGSSFLIPLIVIEKFGFMNQSFFMYGEELDYCYSLWLNKIPSYIVPKSVVVHKGGVSLKDSKYLEIYYRRRNHLYFLKKFYKTSIFKSLNKKIGIYNLIKYFLKYLISSTPKDDLYYLNLANIHAFFNIRGRLK